jgi:hypothetical protein
MNHHLFMAALAVFAATIPSNTWFSLNIATPMMWAFATGFGLYYLKSTP